MGYWPSVRSRWKDIGQVLFRHLDRTTLANKGFIIMTRRTQENSLLAGTEQAIPSGQDGSILTAWVANHSTGFASSCPLIEPAIS